MILLVIKGIVILVLRQKIFYKGGEYSMSSKEEKFLDKRMTEGVMLSLNKAPGIRKEKELFEALEEIEAKVWHNRSRMCKAKGLISKKQMPSVIKAERNYEKKYGFEEMNKKYSDVDWGELMGKLQTIRWVLGCDWGNRDT